MADRDSQRAVVAILPKCSALLSLAGSLWIMVEVATHREKRRQVYHRILWAMSLYDVLESALNFCSTWPIPRGTPDIFQPRGTTASCTIQGFFLQLGLAIPIYNTWLAFYYYLVICRGLSHETIRDSWEFSIHAVTFVIALGTALSAVGLDLFSNANLWCWIAPYPPGCVDTVTDPFTQVLCERGRNAHVYRWTFYFAPLWTCIALALILTTAVYWRVRALERRNRPQRPRRRGLPGTSSSHRSRTRHLTTASLPITQDGDAAAMHNGQDLTEKSMSTTSNKSLLHRSDLGRDPAGRFEFEDSDDDDDLDDSEELSDEEDEEFYQQYKQRLQSQQGSPLATTTGAAQSNNSNGKRPPTPSDTTTQQPPQQRQRRQASQDPPQRGDSNANDSSANTSRSEQVLSQCLWYMAAFAVTHFFSTTNRILQLALDETLYPVLVLHSIFDPLQGFLNFWVYRRPIYLRYRRLLPELTRYQAWYRALRWHFLVNHDMERGQILQARRQERNQRHPDPPQLPVPRFFASGKPKELGVVEVPVNSSNNNKNSTSAGAAKELEPSSNATNPTTNAVDTIKPTTNVADTKRAIRELLIGTRPKGSITERPTLGALVQQSWGALAFSSASPSPSNSTAAASVGGRVVEAVGIPPLSSSIVPHHHWNETVDRSTHDATPASKDSTAMSPRPPRTLASTSLKKSMNQDLPPRPTRTPASTSLASESDVVARQSKPRPSNHVRQYRGPGNDGAGASGRRNPQESLYTGVVTGLQTSHNKKPDDHRHGKHKSTASSDSSAADQSNRDATTSLPALPRRQNFDEDGHHHFAVVPTAITAWGGEPVLEMVFERQGSKEDDDDGVNLFLKRGPVLDSPTNAASDEDDLAKSSIRPEDFESPQSADIGGEFGVLQAI